MTGVRERHGRTAVTLLSGVRGRSCVRLGRSAVGRRRVAISHFTTATRPAMQSCIAASLQLPVRAVASARVNRSRAAPKAAVQQVSNAQRTVGLGLGARLRTAPAFQVRPTPRGDVAAIGCPRAEQQPTATDSWADGAMCPPLMCMM